MTKKKKYRKMTEEENILFNEHIEDSYKFIFDVMYKYPESVIKKINRYYSEDDIKQEALIVLHRVVLNYDSSKGAKITTVLYTSLYRLIQTLSNYIDRKSRQFYLYNNISDIKEDYNKVLLDYNDPLDEYDNYINTVFSNEVLDGLFINLHVKQKEIMRLRILGYNRPEIANIMGIKETLITSYTTQSRKKLEVCKEYFINKYIKE